MLTGDDLQVQLFIAAFAGVFLSIAVTQAGWNSKNFIRSMFASGGVLALVALCWGPITKMWPRLDGFAVSPWWWLLLLMVAFGSLCWLEVRARQRLIERIPEIVTEQLAKTQVSTAQTKFDGLKWPNVSEWLTPNEALNAFSDPALMKQYEEAKARFLQLEKVAIEYRKSEAYKKTQTLDATLQRISSMGNREAYDIDDDPTKESNDAQMQMTLLYNNIWQQFLKMLKNGKLVGRGVLSEGDKTANDWVVIPAAHWVSLGFDFGGDKETATGGGRKYRGIQIGKPKDAVS